MVRTHIHDMQEGARIGSGVFGTPRGAPPKYYRWDVDGKASRLRVIGKRLEASIFQCVMIGANIMEAKSLKHSCMIVLNTRRDFSDGGE